jgi:hypothetical protein
MLKVPGPDEYLARLREGGATEQEAEDLAVWLGDVRLGKLEVEPDADLHPAVEAEFEHEAAARADSEQEVE